MSEAYGQSEGIFVVVELYENLFVRVYSSLRQQRRDHDVDVGSHSRDQGNVGMPKNPLFVISKALDNAGCILPQQTLGIETSDESRQIDKGKVLVATHVTSPVPSQNSSKGLPMDRVAK